MAVLAKPVAANPIQASRATRANDVLRPHEQILPLETSHSLICISTSFSTHTTGCSKSSIACHLCPWYDHRQDLVQLSRRLKHLGKISGAAALLRFAVHKPRFAEGGRLTSASRSSWVSAALLPLDLFMVFFPALRVLFAALLTGTFSASCLSLSR